MNVHTVLGPVDPVPLVREAGVSEADLRTILVENPQRVLAF